MDASHARVASTAQAVDWVRQGWQQFRQAAGIWIGITVVYLIVAIVANWIPYIGPLVLSLVSPVLAVGVMQGVRDQLAGTPLSVAHLFSGFQHPRMGALILLGFITMVGAVIIAVVAALALAGAVVGAAGVEAVGLGTLLGALVVLAAAFLLAAALWFAPPLVAFKGVEPLAAIQASLRTCFTNFVPLLVWGLIAFVLVLLGSIPFGLGLLVVFPILFVGYYLMYRDIFGD